VATASGVGAALTYQYFTHTVRPAGTGGIGAESILEAIDEYFGALSKSGQILLSGCTTISVGDVFITYFLAAGADALDDRFASLEVTSTALALSSLCEGNPRIDRVGVSVDHDQLCVCAERRAFVLTTDMYAAESPVSCLECGSAVPLYQLTSYSPTGGFHDVLAWQKGHAAAERLWFEGVAEASMYRQLRTHNSELSKRGRSLCTALSVSNDATFLYPLFLFEEPYPPNCPVCGRVADLESSSGVQFPWRCWSCHLVIS
jgi:predicted  nucleic acid-binding Zn ribbon protein